MTNAVIITLFASLLFATTNHIDKFMLNGIEKSNNSIKVLVVFSTLIAGVVFTPIWLIINRFSISISKISLICVILSSLAYSLATYFYFKALNKNDTSIVVVMFHLIPVFSYFFALIFFGEKIGGRQIIGSVIILLASILISLDFEKKDNKNRLEVLFLMILSSSLFAIYFILFDIGIRNNTYNACAFWYQVGLLLIGIVLLFIKNIRKAFLQAIINNGKKYLLFNISNESINLTANLLINFANVTIPIAIANILNTFQSVFVFVLGIIGSKLFPKYFNENLEKKIRIRKVTCIFLSMIGLIIMFI